MFCLKKISLKPQRLRSPLTRHKVSFVALNSLLDVDARKLIFRSLLLNFKGIWRDYGRVSVWETEDTLMKKQLFTQFNEHFIRNLNQFTICVEIMRLKWGTLRLKRLNDDTGRCLRCCKTYRLRDLFSKEMNEWWEKREWTRKLFLSSSLSTCDVNDCLVISVLFALSCQTFCWFRKCYKIISISCWSSLFSNISVVFFEVGHDSWITNNFADFALRYFEETLMRFNQTK